ncbi:MAG: hypothetical protein ACLP7J_18745 [Streptosporangiaceae bacterium]
MTSEHNLPRDLLLLVEGTGTETISDEDAEQQLARFEEAFAENAGREARAVSARLVVTNGAPGLPSKLVRGRRSHPTEKGDQ